MCGGFVREIDSVSGDFAARNAVFLLYRRDKPDFECCRTEFKNGEIEQEIFSTNYMKNKSF